MSANGTISFLFFWSELYSRASLVAQQYITHLLMQEMLDQYLGGSLGSGRSPRRRKWQPIPVFLPGKSHGQRSLVGYSPWDHKEMNTISLLNNNKDIRLYMYHIVFIHSSVDGHLGWTYRLSYRVKPEREKQILYMNAYMWSLEKWH